MALTSVGFQVVLASLKSAALKVLGGSQLTIKGIQSVSIDPGTVSQQLEGDGTTLYVAAKANGRATFTWKNAVMDESVLAAIQGDTAPSLGATTTPNFISTTNLKDDHVYPEFAFECVVYANAALDSSATVAAPVERHIRLSHCVLTKVPSFKASGMADGKLIEVGDISGEAWADTSTHILMITTDLQTAAAITL
jgi:hypothetical protein